MSFQRRKVCGHGIYGQRDTRKNLWKVTQKKIFVGFLAKQSPQALSLQSQNKTHVYYAVTLVPYRRARR